MNWEYLITVSDVNLRKLSTEKLLKLKQSVEGGWNPLQQSTPERLRAFGRLNKELIRRRKSNSDPKSVRLASLPIKRILKLTGPEVVDLRHS